ncbi:hypothetical protein [Streptomyces sp. PU-14G]|uniref:hypothetical protein n=1 Tax=Streptomyces sp. PU-14G TaxID=2800808 RepID=UPI0034DEC1C2
MWSEGDRVRDTKSGKAGRVVQVTGPAPFIYRVLLEQRGEGEPPVMIFRYGDQLGAAATEAPGLGRSVATASPPNGGEKRECENERGSPWPAKTPHR